MISAPVPADEARRLQALRSYDILDTEAEKEYDDLCQLAATICETPIALISLVDQDRQWFKSAVGLDSRQTSRDIAFCAHAITRDGVFEVPDATLDERFFDNPLVTGAPDIKYYAGQPLVTSEGLALGTLCAIDRVPRTLGPAQKRALDILARQVVAQLELRRALVDLRRLNDDKDRFFSIIAHDLRSPFSGLLGLADLIQAEGAGMPVAEVLRYVGLMRQSLHQVYALSENLLKWALLEQGKMTFQEETLSVAVLFDEVLYPLEESLKKKGLRTAVEVQAELMVRGDRNMLETALRNLVSNAVKFTPPGGTVTLAAGEAGGAVRLSVSDTGVGMTPKQVESLQSGLRAESTPGTEGEKGTGLGLTLVRQFAGRHGGTMEVASREGVGTVLTLVLPRQELPATQPVAQHS